MPTIKPKYVEKSAIFEGFSGIGKAKKSNLLPCDELQNFRIRADGALEKRCGFTAQHTFDGVVRGFWEGILNGQPARFIAAGNKIYVQKDGPPQETLTLSTTTGEVCFFFYRSSLYLLDGTEIYRYRESEARFFAVEPYVPLLGKNWSPTSLGDYHEPPNLLTKRIRLSYKNLDGALVFELPYAAESLDSVLADGKEITDYVFTSGSRRVTMPKIFSWVEIGMTTLYLEGMPGDIKKCSRVYCDRVQGMERLFLYGGPDSTYLFGSTQVTDHMLASCQTAYPNVDSLYFTDEMMLALGNSTHPITALFPNHDRLLAFHDLGAEAISLIDANDGNYLSTTLSSYPVLRGYGCTAPLPFVERDGKTVLINRGGIYLLSSKAADPDTFELSLIPHDVDDLKTQSFAEHATVFYDAPHDEYWFYDVKNGSRVWVYQVSEKNWYSFTGFSPSFFLTSEGLSGFAEGNRSFLFEDSQMTDNGVPIQASFKSDVLDFDSPDLVKRALRFSLVAACYGTTLEMKLADEDQTGSFVWTAAKPNENGLPLYMERRVGFGRFRMVKFMLTDNGTARTTIHRLALFANS